MSLINNYILEVENIWLEPLHEYIKVLYANVHLPSHDTNHHLRVWYHCKSLITQLDGFGIQITRTNIEEAIIACLFHDTGLIKDKSEQHGLASREFSQQFLYQQKSISEESAFAILNAVQNHDDKSIKLKNQIEKNQPLDLNSLVSAADDLDAFGLMGVYRYIEIYAIRGISNEKLPQKVLDNLNNRFANLQKSYWPLLEFMRDHQIRYNLTYNFFLSLTKFEQSITSESDNLQVYKFILKEILNQGLSIDDLITKANSTDYSCGFKSYFYNLKHELDLFS